MLPICSCPLYLLYFVCMCVLIENVWSAFGTVNLESSWRKCMSLSKEYTVEVPNPCVNCENNNETNVVTQKNTSKHLYQNTFFYIASSGIKYIVLRGFKFAREWDFLCQGRVTPHGLQCILYVKLMCNL